MLDKRKLVLKESQKHPGWKRWQKQDHDDGGTKRFMHAYTEFIMDLWENRADPIDESPLMDYKNPRKLVENIPQGPDRDAFFKKSKVYFADSNDEFWDWNEQKSKLNRVITIPTAMVVPAGKMGNDGFYWEGENIIIANPYGYDALKDEVQKGGHRIFEDTLRIYKNLYGIEDNDAWADLSLSHELAHSYNFSSYNPWSGDRLKRTLKQSGDFRSSAFKEVVHNNPRLQYMEKVVEEIPSILTEMAIYSPRELEFLDYVVQKSDTDADVPSQWLKNFWGFDARKEVYK